MHTLNGATPTAATQTPNLDSILATENRIAVLDAKIAAARRKTTRRHFAVAFGSIVVRASILSAAAVSIYGPKAMWVGPVYVAAEELTA